MTIVSTSATGNTRPGRFGKPPAWAWLCGPMAIVLLICLALPMISLLRASFIDGDRTFDGSGFSLQHYLRFLTDSYYLVVTLETLALGAASALLSLVLGFPVGYGLARMPHARRRWMMIVVILPLTLSLVVVVFGWLVILGRTGLINAVLLGLGIVDEPVRFLFNSPAVVVVLTQQFLPFMILSVMSAVSQIDLTLEQAAANLRANRLTTFRRVILPLAMPGILSGLTLVFVLSVSAFITPRLVGGYQVQMLGSLIYEQIVVVLNWPFGAAMSVVLFALTLGITVGVNIFLARRAAVTPR